MCICEKLFTTTEKKYISRIEKIFEIVKKKIDRSFEILYRKEIENKEEFDKHTKFKTAAKSRTSYRTNKEHSIYKYTKTEPMIYRISSHQMYINESDKTYNTQITTVILQLIH